MSARSSSTRGPRASGRAPGAARPVSFELGYQRQAEGSCLIHTGRTAVLCAVSVEERVPHFLRGTKQGWITAEYGMLPRSTGDRTARDVWRGKAGGRTHEIQRMIGRSLRAVADLSALGERCLIVDCDVIEADGGTRTAAVTGAFVALVQALRKLAETGHLQGQVLSDYLAAVSVGVVDGRAVVDLDYTEDVAAAVDMNVVMTRGGRFVELQGTAEHEPFSEAMLGRLLGLATTGIRKLTTAQRRVLGTGRLP